MMIELFASFVLILTSIYIYFKYFLYEYWRKRGVISPDPIVPFGNIWNFFTGSESLRTIYNNNYQKYKSDHRYFGLYLLHQAQLIIIEPELIKFVLVKEFTSFHDRNFYCNEKSDPLSGHLVALAGTKWRNLRVKLTPTFTSGKIKQMFPTFQQVGSELSNFLDDHLHSSNTNIIEMKDVYARFATDIIMTTAFGMTCNTLKHPDSEIRYWQKKAFQPKKIRGLAMLFAPQLLKLFSISVMTEGVAKFFINIFKENVRYRKENNVTRHDFLNLLMQLMDKGFVAPDDENKKEIEHDKSKLEKLTMLEAAAQAFVFIFAGFETSSTTATFCLYELAINQDIQNKLREEINQVLRKHEQLTYDSLNDMSYLHKVVSETLRKYPPGTNLSRLCTKDVVLPGTNITIEKGTTVIIPVLGIHHNAKIYPNPDKFDPERFDEENIASRHPYVYLPFGEGPRICIGMRLGMLLTKTALINALSKFRFKLAPNTLIPMEFEIRSPVLSPKGGLPLVIERVLINNKIV